MHGSGASGAPGPSRRSLLTGGALIVAVAASGGVVAAVAGTRPTLGRASPSTSPTPTPTPTPVTPTPAPLSTPIPEPRFIGAPVPAVELHPAAFPRLQSFTFLPETGEWFTTQASGGTSGLIDAGNLEVGDIVVSRLASDGTLLDAMTLPDSGHGMGLVVRLEAGVRVVYSCWFAPDASGRLYDVVRIPYAPGVASRAAAVAVVAGVGHPLDPCLDVSTDAVTLRHQGGGGPQYTRHRWSDFVAGNLSRPTGLVATPDSPPTHQGFCSLDDRFFFYTGAASDRAGGDPTLITEYDWISGEVVAPPLDASGNSRQPDGTYPGGRMEAEGATIVTGQDGVPSLLVGVANGTAAGAAVARTYRTFRYPLVSG